MTNEQIENEAASYVGDILGLDYIGEAEAERIALENGHKDVYMEWDGKETPRDILDFYVREGYMIASDEVVLCKKLMEGKL